MCLLLLEDDQNATPLRTATAQRLPGRKPSPNRYPSAISPTSPRTARVGPSRSAIPTSPPRRDPSSAYPAPPPAKNGAAPTPPGPPNSSVVGTRSPGAD